MQITMTTAFGKMKFDILPDQVGDLLQRALRYAVEQSTERVPKETNPKSCEVLEIPNQVLDKPKKPQMYEMEGYKGFLLIKCEHCGKIKGFCAKTPIVEHRCECGGITKLHDLKPVYLKCKCGSHFTYSTNITDKLFDYHCLNCGNPVDLEWNKRRNEYDTISE